MKLKGHQKLSKMKKKYCYEKTCFPFLPLSPFSIILQLHKNAFWITHCTKLIQKCDTQGENHTIHAYKGLGKNMLLAKYILSSLLLI